MQGFGHLVLVVSVLFTKAMMSEVEHHQNFGSNFGSVTFGSPPYTNYEAPLGLGFPEITFLNLFKSLN